MFPIPENQYLQNYDTIILGSGIIGLSCAASILESHPSHRLLILERGLIPTGASTRNAGITAAGDYEEVLDDIENYGEQEAFNRVKAYKDSVLKLRERLGDENIDYKQHGGYNILTEKVLHKLEKFDYVNKLLCPIYNENIFSIENEKIEEFGFNKDIVKALVLNKFEGQIDSGRTVVNLLKYVKKLGAIITTGASVLSYKNNGENGITVNVKNPTENKEPVHFTCGKLVLCLNAFSETFVKDMDMYPGRGQVVVTTPIKDLKLKGSFVFDDGYYYFREYYGRVLLGGGRHLDLEGETTLEAKNTEMIVENLRKVLKEVILPNKEFDIEYKWAGIMCFGRKTSGPIVTKLEDNVYAAMRMSGIGMTLSSNIGEKLKDLMFSQDIIKPKL